MTEKNWLIRTKNNHILGPISKQKVIELLEENTIRQDDELCSGNGYWFKVSEEELLNQYIFGDLKQSFDPVSDAPTIMAWGLSLQENEIESVFPDDKDLEYPDDGGTVFSGNIDRTKMK